ncbi:MAG: hypothetical protein K2O69_06885, partial [Odoribacter sp.]|nr:hypothetical protein [Odoribacter sp.]
MKKHISFIVILLLLAGQMADAQKKALQQEDCERWRTVRDPKISEDGRWVTYRYSHLYKNDNPDLFLYDAERNKTTTLKNVTDFFFFGNGKWAKIVQQTPLDTTGQTVDSTFMVRLRDWKKIHWDKAAYPNANAASASIAYTEPVEKNGKTFNRLVVWNVETGEKNSIERVGTYTLFNDRQSVIYEHKGDGATGLRVQDLKGKPREIFRVEKGIFGSYWFDEEKQAGTFTVASDSSRQYNPD